MLLLIPRLTVFSSPYIYRPPTLTSKPPPSKSIHLLVDASLRDWSTPSSYYTSTPSPLPLRPSALSHYKAHLRGLAVLAAVLALAACFPDLLDINGTSLKEPLRVRDGLGWPGAVLQSVVDLVPGPVKEVVVSVCFGVSLQLVRISCLLERVLVLAWFTDSSPFPLWLCHHPALIHTGGRIPLH